MLYYLHYSLGNASLYCLEPVCFVLYHYLSVIRYPYCNMSLLLNKAVCANFYLYKGPLQIFTFE